MVPSGGVSPATVGDAIEGGVGCGCCRARVVGVTVRLMGWGLYHVRARLARCELAGDVEWNMGCGAGNWRVRVWGRGC